MKKRRSKCERYGACVLFPVASGPFTEVPSIGTRIDYSAGHLRQAPRRVPRPAGVGERPRTPGKTPHGSSIMILSPNFSSKKLEKAVSSGVSVLGTKTCAREWRPPDDHGVYRKVLRISSPGELVVDFSYGQRGTSTARSAHVSHLTSLCRTRPFAPGGKRWE